MSDLDSVVIIEAGDLPPEVAPWVGATYVYVEEVDLVYERAMKLGAKSVASPRTNRIRNVRQGSGWWKHLVDREVYGIKVVPRILAHPLPAACQGERLTLRWKSGQF